MKREFLEGLGLDKNAVDQIMAEYGSDLQREKAKADQIKSDLANAQAVIRQNEYTNAVSRAVTDLGLKFSSLAAERDFIAAVQNKQLQWENGSLVGLDDFIQDRKSSDPGAFLSDRPAPRFIAGGDGDGHGVPGGVSLAEWMAESIGKAGADRNRTANSVISNYKGGSGFYGA